MSTEPIEIIIDTDAGIDDATAILGALRHPNARVKALTVVDGNVDLPQAVKNCKTLIAVAGRPDIPIYSGADGPLLRGITKKALWEGHGVDGFGGFTVSEEWANFQQLHLPGVTQIATQPEHAANAIISMVNEQPGKLSIVALGPLTNLAIAISIDPTLLSKVKDVYIMGGCLFAKGNANRAAEFNIHSDPEAAHIVFTSSTLHSKPPSAPKISLFTWEMTLEHGFPWSLFDTLTSEPTNSLGALLKSCTKTAMELSRAQFELLAGPGPTVEFVSRQELGERREKGESKWDRGKRRVDQEYLYQVNAFIMPDLYAAVGLLEPDSVLSYKDWDVQIELHGGHTRGMTHMEWSGITTGVANARVVLAMDKGIVEDFLLKTFKGKGSEQT
ncbi:hypothetical protein HK097_005524 [Rhizophlyctis rosea]|uniref:Inosine/uridine-preferring nucleoside hydrolase domain-containing protein n=1 Tax=Rhizophlyctis rosea TaxID=64517 RepID=A0AAD5X633_9FUNG|nr:hypothetical protein HK097_005524 [Rhizophlyctis rosea]